MNNIQNLSFKATPEEIKSIKKACINLSNTEKPSQSEPVDVAEIGSKAYISKIQNGHQSLVKIELKNNKGANAYTLINTKNPKNTQKFLNLDKNIKKLAEVLDSLKETVQKASEREAYTD